MINAIETAIEVVRKAAREQSASVVRELHSEFDARNIAIGQYDEKIRAVRAMREEADDLERRAYDELNSAITNSNAVILSIVNQINQGQMVTSIDSPSPRKKIDSSPPSVSATAPTFTVGETEASVAQ